MKSKLSNHGYFHAFDKQIKVSCLFEKNDKTSNLSQSPIDLYMDFYKQF